MFKIPMLILIFCLAIQCTDEVKEWFFDICTQDEISCIERLQDFTECTDEVVMKQMSSSFLEVKSYDNQKKVVEFNTYRFRVSNGGKPSKRKRRSIIQYFNNNQQPFLKTKIRFKDLSNVLDKMNFEKVNQEEVEIIKQQRDLVPTFFIFFPNRKETKENHLDIHSEISKYYNIIQSRILKITERVKEKLSGQCRDIKDT